MLRTKSRLSASLIVGVALVACDDHDELGNGEAAGGASAGGLAGSGDSGSGASGGSSSAGNANPGGRAGDGAGKAGEEESAGSHGRDDGGAENAGAPGRGGDAGRTHTEGGGSHDRDDGGAENAGAPGRGGDAGRTQAEGGSGADGGASGAAGAAGSAEAGGGGGNTGCVPNTAVCIRSGVVRCSADGEPRLEGCWPFGVSCVEDGAGDADCVPWICAPQSGECTGEREVKFCSLVSYFSFDCASRNQYCVHGDCVDQLCEQNQPVCDVQRAKVCNAEGTGYVGDGVNCGQRGCKAGVCREVLFSEDWESATGGNFGSAVWPQWVRESSAADGTNYGLRLVGPPDAPSGTAAEAHFDPIVPTHISLWVRPSSNLSRGCSFSLRGADDLDSARQIVLFTLESNGWFRLMEDTDVTTYLANSWLRVELDLDWVDKALELSIDGVSHGRTSFYDTTATAARHVVLQNLEGGFCDWDELVME
jgi:hypothetical protein